MSPALTHPNRIQPVILAAGLSQRFGAENKLMASLDGKPVIKHVLDTVAAVPLLPALIVTGHNSAVADLIAPPMRRVHNPAPETGLASSLRLGVQAAEQQGALWLLVLLGDMPFITPALIHALIANAATDMDVVMCGADGRSAPPALWHQRMFRSLAKLTGDRGALALAKQPGIRSKILSTDANHLRDIDTRDDLTAPERHAGSTDP